MGFKENMTKEEFELEMKAVREATEKRTARKFEGFIDPNSDEYANTQKELAGFKQAKFESTIEEQFKKVNGVRTKDFIKLSGISMDTPEEEIQKTIKDFRKNEDYGFLFKPQDQSPEVDGKVITQDKPRSMTWTRDMAENQ